MQNTPSFSGLRIASLVDTHAVSGLGRQLAALAPELIDHGVDLRVFMFQRRGRPEAPFAAYLERAGIAHVVLPERGPLDMSVVGALGRELRGWQPDIVETHNYRMTALAFLLRRLGATWPWIAFFHGSTNENWKMRIYNRIDRALLPTADRLVVMSELHRRSFAGARKPPEVIYNAVIKLPREGDPISIAHLRRPGTHLVGVIGRLSPEKGVDLLLQAAAQRSREGFPFSLVIAGDGPERQNLQSQADSLGIAEWIHFLGPVRDVTSLYDQLDLVVLPSRSEGLPNVLLEALSANVPVVATAVGAVPEVLRGTQAGELVAPGEPAKLADAIGRALHNGSTPAAVAARRTAAERFSLTNRVARHLALYAELRPDRLVSPVPTLSRHAS